MTQTSENILTVSAGGRALVSIFAQPSALKRSYFDEKILDGGVRRNHLLRQRLVRCLLSPARLLPRKQVGAAPIGRPALAGKPPLERRRPNTDTGATAIKAARKARSRAAEPLPRLRSRAQPSLSSFLKTPALRAGGERSIDLRFRRCK